MVLGFRPIFDFGPIFWPDLVFQAGNPLKCKEKPYITPPMPPILCSVDFELIRIKTELYL